MKTEKEIAARLHELDERMMKVHPMNPVNTISIDAQRYALQWVLGRV